MNLKVRFFNGGYCRQLLALVDKRSWKFVRFHAVFLAMQHPNHGWIVVDTGYGGRFREATRRWPYRLYRYVTPANMAGTAADALKSAGINPAEIRHLIVTHFHADHVGGLIDFPLATIHYHEDAWRPLAMLTPLRRTRSAFLPELLPADLHIRGRAISADAFKPSNELPFLVHDLFGDGSIRLVSLPGHAPGHIGVLLANDHQEIFYTADAFWRMAQIEDGLEIPRLARSFQWDPAAYAETVGKLREACRLSRFKLLACHDTETQAYVESLPN